MKRFATPQVYLIHFGEPYQHARHYLGYSANVQRRLSEHRRGQGVGLTAVVASLGIELKLVRVWSGGRNLEKALRNYNNNPKLCPLCSPGRRQAVAGKSRKKRGDIF